MDRNISLKTKLEETSAENIKSGNSSFYQIDNPQPFLEWLVLNNYSLHGSARKIEGKLIPKEAIDLIKESGNRKAVYMTINPLLAMFTALTGGAKVGERRSQCFLEINNNQLSYPRKPDFAVALPEAIANEGYIYVFDRKTQVDEEIAGELLSYKAILPLLVIRINKSQFNYPINKLDTIS